MTRMAANQVAQAALYADWIREAGTRAKKGVANNLDGRGLVRCSEMITALLAEREALIAESEARQRVAEWYAERAKDLARYGTTKPTQVTAMEAVVCELMLDAGKRALAMPQGGSLHTIEVPT